MYIKLLSYVALRNYFSLVGC